MNSCLFLPLLLSFYLVAVTLTVVLVAAGDVLMMAVLHNSSLIFSCYADNPSEAATTYFGDFVLATWVSCSDVF